MEIKSILADKQLKAKPKVVTISQMLLHKEVEINELIKIARISKDKDKGTCIEAIEFAIRVKPEIVSSACVDFVIEMLADEAPRVKWESAKVIGSIAHLYPDKLDIAISNLLTNSEYSGTVVRWSVAFALGEILKLKTKRNIDLIPAIESIIRRDDNKAIKKIYQAALKKATA